MQIIVKCWTPECYDAVSHAIIEVDLNLIEMLARRLALANKMKLEDSEFTGLQFNRYDPTFIDMPVELMDDFGMTEEEFDDLSDGGWSILPEKMDGHEWDYVGMRPCKLMVIAGEVVTDSKFEPTGEIRENSGRIYWCGFDKHGNSECRAETYAISSADLQELAGILGFGLCKLCGKELAKGHVVCAGCQDD